MKILLNQDVKGLGKKGEIKEVSNGYARNYLLPKNIAVIATEEVVKKSDQEKIKKDIQVDLEKKELKNLVQKIKGKVFIIESKANEEKLFGSINRKDIIKSLSTENINLKEDWIKLDQPIKELGIREIEIELPFKIKTKLSVEIKEAK
jgi:large subunit ribosomal protein L9